MNEEYRIEHDSLGKVKVPARALWGAQTERARRNFRISGIQLNRFPWLMVAFAMTKQAAARANGKLGRLDERKLQAIESACAEIASGQHHDAFPLDYLQGGAGTSLNMNANEVIANLANERLGGRRGFYEPVRPIDDVNASQSTNDVYPTAIRLSVLLAHKALEEAVSRLADAFDERAAAFGEVIKLGRTQMQDAVPMTLGQEFRKPRLQAWRFQHSLASLEADLAIETIGEPPGIGVAGRIRPEFLPVRTDGFLTPGQLRHAFLAGTAGTSSA